MPQRLNTYPFNEGVAGLSESLGLNRGEAGQHQVQKDEWIRAEGTHKQATDIQGNPNYQKHTKRQDECPTSAEPRDLVRGMLAKIKNGRAFFFVGDRCCDQTTQFASCLLACSYSNPFPNHQ